MGEWCWGLEKDGSSFIGNRTDAEKGYEHWHLQPHLWHSQGQRLGSREGCGGFTGNRKELALCRVTEAEAERSAGEAGGLLHEGVTLGMQSQRETDNGGVRITKGMAIKITGNFKE